MYMRAHLFIIALTGLIACGKPVSKEQKNLDAALEAYKANPSDSTSVAYASAYNAFTDLHGFSDPVVSRYMLEGARLSEARQKLNPALAWYESYFTRYQDSPDFPDHLVEAASLIEAFGKPELSQVFYKSFIDRFPTHKGAASIKAKITDPSLSVDSSLQLVLNSIPKGANNELDPERIQLYIEMVEVSIFTNPNLPLGAEHLLKAAEIGRIVKLYPRSIKLYDWVIRFYPTSKYATSAIFLKGYITYFDLKNYEKANTLIKEYLAKDPYGQFELQANFMLDNPGKSEEDLKKAMGGE